MYEVVKWITEEGKQQTYCWKGSRLAVPKRTAQLEETKLEWSCVMLERAFCGDLEKAAKLLWPLSSYVVSLDVRDTSNNMGIRRILSYCLHEDIDAKARLKWKRIWILMGPFQLGMFYGSVILISWNSWAPETIRSHPVIKLLLINSCTDSFVLN